MDTADENWLCGWIDEGPATALALAIMGAGVVESPCPSLNLTCFRERSFSF